MSTVFCNTLTPLGGGPLKGTGAEFGGGGLNCPGGMPPGGPGGMPPCGGPGGMPP